MTLRSSVYRTALLKLEKYCSERDYSGYCKFDALNSPILRSLFGHFYLSRLLITQLVNRIPGLRALFFVPKGKNPKGIANFIRAYSKMKGFENQIVKLADWLLENDSRSHGKYSGPGRAWGYHFPWQSPAFYQPVHSPNCIVTVFCGEALLDAYRVTGHDRFLEGAVAASSYVLGELPVLASDEDRLCIGYVKEGLSWKVVNINSVVAGFLSRLFEVSAEGRYLEKARRLIRWVWDARDPENGLWNYTDPKGQSGIGPDNYHTGGILDGILEHAKRDSTAGATEKEYLRSLKVFSERFFTSDGAPRWRLDQDYPFDIHGSAQAILTFVSASDRHREYLEYACKVADWTIREMQDPVTGRFFYQRYPFFTWKVDLMRWNNSWMMRALSELCNRLEGDQR